METQHNGFRAAFRVQTPEVAPFSVRGAHQTPSPEAFQFISPYFNSHLEHLKQSFLSHLVTWVLRTYPQLFYYLFPCHSWDEFPPCSG